MDVLVMEQKTSHTNKLSNESELQPNQFYKPPEYYCISYSLHIKCIYFATGNNAFPKKHKWYYCRKDAPLAVFYKEGRHFEGVTEEKQNAVTHTIALHIIGALSVTMWKKGLRKNSRLNSRLTQAIFLPLFQISNQPLRKMFQHLQWPVFTLCGWLLALSGHPE